MKGLLLKDFYAAFKYFRVFFIICLLFVLMSCLSPDNLFFVFYPCLISGMIPVNLLAYDEADKWEVYCGTLPCSRKDFVTAKYMMGVFSQLVVLVLVGIAQSVRMLVAGEFYGGELGTILSLLVIISCATAGLTMPFMFKLGVQKGRMAYYVMVGMVCGGSVAAGSIFRDKLQMEVSFSNGILIVAVLAILIYAGSWLLSVKWYEKRDLNG